MGVRSLWSFPPLASPLDGVTVLRAELGAPRSLGGAARLRPAPRAFPWKMTVLWAVLGLGVMLLAWMSYRLSRELGKLPTTGQ
jgi:hypothetical protein